MAKGYLTAAEYSAIRKTLGFTQEEAAAFHRMANSRAIRRWESGKSFISDHACDKILELFTKINTTIKGAVDEYAHKKKAQGGEDGEVVLIVYPNAVASDWVRGLGDLPNNVHRAMIARTYTALKDEGADVHIIEFDVADYVRWLGAHGRKDGQDSRAAWAVDYHAVLII